MEDEGLTMVRQRWTEGRQSQTGRRADEGFEERATQRVEGVKGRRWRQFRREVAFGVRRRGLDDRR